MFLQVVKYFRGDTGCEFLFGEVLFIDEGLDLGKLVRYFVPLVVYYLTDLAKSVDLLFHDVIVEHSKELGG